MKQRVTIDSDYVVLLHGLGSRASTMRRIQRYLALLGFHVYNETYASTSHSIEKLADQVALRIAKACPDGNKKIHFVTYSMGGIVARIILDKYRPKNLGRVVMIAPPNQGTEVADFVRRFKPLRKIYGPATHQLGTGKDSLIPHLGKIDYELGVIAGNRSVDPFFSRFVLKGENDGRVTVESTKHEAMKDHLVVPASHTFIQRKKSVIMQVVYFLHEGKFNH